MEKQWMSCEEFAQKAGLSTGYVRELCVMGKKDKENGIIAEKLGKAWRIPITEFNRKLNIEKQEKSLEREVYIKELEQKIKNLELQISTIKNLVLSFSNI